MDFSWLGNFFYSQLFVTPAYPVTDFTDQTVIVTGANTGLGFEAAKHLVRLNVSKVIIAVRNLQKGSAAKEAIEHATGRKGVVEVWQLDLSSYESVKDFAAQVSNLERLDAMIENAGIGGEKLELKEGLESTITVNVISTELLALLVLPKLQETATRFNVQPRLSIVTSDLHFIVKFPERNSQDIFKELSENNSHFGERYQVTKLIELFFIRELALRINASKKPKVVVNCMTPGVCASDFFRDPSFIMRITMPIMYKLLARTTEVGARTLIAGASAGIESHGEYMADGVVASPSNLVLSAEGKDLQTRLWDQTIQRLENIQPGISSNI
ncbi:NAD(P)-binding protein-20 [Coleophoma crateriformis]|uniref:NAD(P)-binding protein-20 n=1 Tax=Coleophoma crateriformis TaxID=565419 RepID=A0A3D8QZ44_9HELO|nr:NAD(P)-binding protein-20 [Coleophoma crateriformis]